MAEIESVAVTVTETGAGTESVTVTETESVAVTETESVAVTVCRVPCGDRACEAYPSPHPPPHPKRAWMRP